MRAQNLRFAYAFCLISGCSTTTWRMQAPEEQLTATEITHEDLGLTEHPQAAGDDERESKPMPAHGMSGDASKASVPFPTGLAVVRVAATMEGRNGGQIRVAACRPEREAYWNQMVNDLPEVREVIVLRGGLSREGFRREDALRRAAALGCNLCLVYARIEGLDCDQGAEYAAVLWDTQDARILASYRVPVQVQRDDDDEATSKDVVRAASRADDLAEANLRGQVRRAVWEMAKRHQPSMDTRTSPWQNRPGVPGMLPRGNDRYHLIERSQK